MKRQKFPLTIWVGSKPPTSGFSLVELILAVALFGLFATAFIGLLVVSYDSDVQAAQRDRATLYAQEGMDAVFSIRRQGWNLLNNGTYGLTDTNGYYEFFGSSNVLEDLYTREITITDACRDGGGELTDCPGVGADLKVKKVTATVSYTGLTGFAHEIVFSTYLSTWQTAIWTQTEWSGGGGQPIWSDETQYSSDDGKIDVDTTAGQVTLATITGGGCGVKTWPFSTAGEYTYNSSLIEVTSSVAQLIAAAGGGVSGTTLNPDFSTNTSGWTYSDWDQGGGEVNVTGARQASGGNPTGYVQVNVPSGSNDELGGYWHQAFTTTVNNPTATLDFDWVVTVYDAVPNTFQLYIFVDTASGAPTIGTEVWSSGEITSAQGWNSETSIDISSAIPTAGTYYLKIAVWVQTPGGSSTGPFTIGYDNVQLNWTGSSYPTSNPNIYPTSSYAVSSIDVWTAFNETADKGGGEIYYQLSDNNGSTWQYWNGSSWTAAGLSQYNTASLVNTNIGAFSTSSGQISFRAFLASDGSQQVQLDEVRISCAQAYDWPFAVAGEYTYDPEVIEVTDGMAQLVDQGGSGMCSGTPNACTIFSDQLSCEGQGGCVWTSGGGASGTTLNSDFSTNTNGWTYSDWDQTGGEVNVTGARNSSGGNSGGWVEVNFPVGRQDELGGYWHQAFTTTVNNPTATLDFDWVVTVYDAVPNTFQLYIFVDTASGAPTIGTEVWSSGEITSAQGWNSETSIDISSAIPTAGTYYLKIAVWVETGNSNTGPFEAGYDNVELNWVGGSNNFCSGTPAACTNYGDQPLCENQSGCLWSASVSYPTDNPLISPTNSYVGSNIQNWTAFNETADKGGGEIYYQLSDNNGSTWQYWNGSSWTAAGLSQYNTASVVNTNISAFSTSSGQISFRAFLASDGSQQVQLSNVKIGWGQDASDGGYETSGLLTSSAFPMTAVATEQASVAILEWDEVIPSCTPSCQLQLQVRTAPDASGSPGSWSDWYGNSGSGSYFTNPLGTVLSVDLNDARWAQYRALFTGDGNDTPVLTEVRLQYLP